MPVRPVESQGRAFFVVSAIAVAGCGDATQPLVEAGGWVATPTPWPAATTGAGLDAYAGDGVVKVYWSGEGWVALGGGPDSARVARVDISMSDQGPDLGFGPLLEAPPARRDSVIAEALTNGVTYYFRLTQFDSAGTEIGARSQVMATPGGPPRPSSAYPAPQPDDPVWYSNLSWSPDGREIALIRSQAPGGRPDLFIVDAVTGGERRVTTFDTSPTPYRIMSVSWSPHGAWLAFSYTPSTTYGSLDYRVWRVAPDGSGREPLSAGRVDSDAAWINQGELVFSQGTHGPPNVPELVRLSIAGGARQTPITEGRTLHKYQSVYAPGIDAIAFSGGSDSRDLYVVPATGGQPVPITESGPHLFGDMHPEWALDERTVLFASNRSGHYEVWAVDAVTGHLSQVTRGLTPGIQRFQPRLSPMGTRLAYLESSGEPDRRAFNLVITSFPN